MQTFLTNFFDWINLSQGCLSTYPSDALFSQVGDTKLLQIFPEIFSRDRKVVCIECSEDWNLDKINDVSDISPRSACLVDKDFDIRNNH